jgi:hypothetical protein
MLIVFKKGIVKNEKLYICEIWMNIKKFIIKLIPIDQLMGIKRKALTHVLSNDS